jgi:hypothetical protein
VSVEAVTLDQLAHDPSKATTLSCEIRGRLLLEAAGVIVALSAAGPTDIQTVKQPETQEEYLTLGELAERTGYGKSSIRAWVTSGFLKRGEHYMGDGKKRRYFMHAIRAHLTKAPLPTSPVTVPVTPFVRKGRRRHG